MTLYLPPWQNPGHSMDWKMRCNISLLYQLATCQMILLLLVQNSSWQGTSRFGSCIKTDPGGGGYVLSLRGHKRSGPSIHPPGPLGVCNPNENQKPPPLLVRSVGHRNQVRTLRFSHTFAPMWVRRSIHDSPHMLNYGEYQ